MRTTGKPHIKAVGSRGEWPEPEKQHCFMVQENHGGKVNLNFISCSRSREIGGESGLPLLKKTAGEVCPGE